MMHTTLLNILTLTSLVLFTGCEKHSSSELVNQPAPEKNQISDYTDQEKELLKDVDEMFKQKDASILMKRTYEDEDYGEVNRKIDKEYLEGVIDIGCSNVELERISPPEMQKQGHDGKTYKWSLPLKWRLIVHEPKNKEGFGASYLIHLSDQEDRLVIIRELATGQ